MQFGMPITTITGGTNAIIMEISNPKTNMLPNDQITPIITTNIEIKVALTERKNRKRINAVISKVKIIKSVISFLICIELTVRIYGKPE